jgi:hypothetical protein
MTGEQLLRDRGDPTSCTAGGRPEDRDQRPSADGGANRRERNVDTAAVDGAGASARAVKARSA